MASVHVAIDYQECHFGDKKFEYIADPTIISVKPKEAIFKWVCLLCRLANILCVIVNL